MAGAGLARTIQKSIDDCAARGGGTVSLPPGHYRSGTIVLRSNVTLHLEAGAVLSGSTDLADYPSHIPAFRSFTDTYTEKSLIYAENVEDIAIEGRGLIDGQGAAFQGPYKVRPYMIRIIQCRNVSVTGVTMKDSPMWVQHYLACDGVLIDGITVLSKCNANNDGIDIDGCQRVRILSGALENRSAPLVIEHKAGFDDVIFAVEIMVNAVWHNLCKYARQAVEQLTALNATIGDRIHDSQRHGPSATSACALSPKG